MKIIRPDQFKELGRRSSEILRQAPDLDRETKEVLEVQKRRSAVNDMIQSTVGMRFNAVVEGAPRHAAAFVSKANIQSGKYEGNIVASIYDRPRQALHAAKHEKMHIRSGLTEIDLKEELNAEQLVALQHELGITEDDPTFWLEGFNELATISEDGKDPNCGYNDEEVPAAEKLERLSIRATGISLLPLYKQGNKQGFFDQLRTLCDALLIETIRANLMKKAA